MGKKCVLSSCQKLVEPGRTLFSFPSDPAKRESWFRAIAPDLPKDATVDFLKNKVICNEHFQPVMYALSGNRHRLFCNAHPKTIDPNAEPEPGTKKDKGTQATIVSKVIVQNENELKTLRRRVKFLENQVKRLKEDPPASLVFRNRHKLASNVTEEAWLLFDCAVQNQRKQKPQSNRHNPDIKKLTLSIARTNRKAFKMLKPIFSLPSLRTLGRMDDWKNGNPKQITDSSLMLNIQSNDQNMNDINQLKIHSNSSCMENDQSKKLIIANVPVTE